MNLPSEFQDLSNGLIAIFLVQDNQKMLSTQQDFLDFSKQNSQTDGDIQIIFASTKESDLDLLKLEQESILTMDSRISKNQSEKIIFLHRQDDQLKYLTHREKPELETNWIQIIQQFSQNYNNSNPDQEGYYFWGQIVPETTQYLCKDCGLIEEFEAGSVFPICEACLSGDPTCPDSYAGPEEGFWEKL